MIKKISVSAILFFAVIATASASETSEFNIGYRGLTWDESLSDALTADKKNEVTSYLNNQFIQILTSSGLFVVSESPQEEGKREEYASGNYSLFPVITVFKEVESEISGYFFDCQITLTVRNDSDTEVETEVNPEVEVPPEVNADLNTGSDGSASEVFYLKHIGSGKNSAIAMQKSLEGIVDQFEFLLIGFEQWSDSFRVIDIYQGAVIINSGKKRGLRKGDFLHSFDYKSGKITGDFVVEKTDGDISYARILKVKKYPKAGDPLRLDDFIGFSVNGYTDYFSGGEFSGYTSGVSLLWSGGLYVFHPLAGFEYFSIKDINDAFIDILIPYGGFKIVRHIGAMTLSSLITAGAGYVSDSDLLGTEYRGWQYKGGTVKASVERRFGNRFSVFAEAGYSYWYSDDVRELTDIAGFLAGGGVSVKF